MCLHSICFALFLANNVFKKTFRRAKCLTCQVVHLRKIFLITLPLLFKKWVGQLNPIYFVEGIRIIHGIALTYTKLIDFHSHGIFTLLLTTVFN